MDKSMKAVDFFCGGGGMSYGMQEAGVQVLAGIDYEAKCKETFEANITGSKFIQADVFELEASDLQKQLNLKKIQPIKFAFSLIYIILYIFL